MGKIGTSSNRNYSRIEFRIATIALLIYFIYKVIAGAIYPVTAPVMFEQNNIHFNYFANDLIPSIIQASLYYGSFILLSGNLQLQLKDKTQLKSGILLILLVYTILSIAIAVTNTYIKAYVFAVFGSSTAAYNFIYFNAFLSTGVIGLLFLFYHISTRSLSIAVSEEKKYISSPLKSICITVVIWLTILILLIIWPGYTIIGVSWLIGFPFLMIVFYINIYWLIPQTIKLKQKRIFYILKALPVIILFSIAGSIFFAVGIPFRSSSAFIIILSVFLLAGFFSALLAWQVFKNNATGIYINNLTAALGKSTANLDFLRSQINPHFLFNALNTIYGTALQENAERTGEAVQKLGDMMRFMLHENTQEKILLQREIEYLENYISLQKLRTASSELISIDTDIEVYTGSLQIAPMLLIPFVENAFKHGISMREVSHIKTSLHARENKLYYDVYNSIHHSTKNDPEVEQHGVGLENVKQRLQLLYPQKHELIIRETIKEYFIHLTIKLS